MVRLITNILGFSVRQTLIGLWFATPWAIRLFIFTTWLSILGLLGIWKGVPEVADRVADEWTALALDAKFPSIWETQLHRFFFVLAILSMIAGWLITAFTTVFIVRLIF